MPAFRYSRRAEADLLSIARYTLRTYRLAVPLFGAWISHHDISSAVGR